MRRLRLVWPARDGLLALGGHVTFEPERCPGCPRSRENAEQTRQNRAAIDRLQGQVAQGQLAILEEFKRLTERLDVMFGATRISKGAAMPKKART